MSQPFNYSHFPGQPPPYPGQPPAPPRPYQYTPAPIQPASSFYASPPSATEPSPTVVSNNYASINGSFQYNGSSIPGLGICATPTNAYRVEANMGFQPTSAAPSSPAFTAPAAQPQSIVGLQGAISPFAPRPSAVVQSPTGPANRRSEEEGELTEFEDLYEPRGFNDSVAVQKQPSRQLPGTTEDVGSIGDADGSSIYDSGSNREEVVIDSTSASLPPADGDDDYEPHEYEPEYQPRENSRSYSPHLSPVEVRHEDPITKRVTSKGDESAPVVASSASMQAPIGNNSPSQNPSQSSLPYKTVLEAKKKAQEAILGLWSHKVRYQNYLDEGLDPQVVKALFTELGLDVSSLKPVVSVSKPTMSGTPATAIPQANKATAQSSPKTTPQASEPVQGSAAAPQSGQPEPGKPATNGEPKMMEKKSAQEERKDKIARMLAEKSKKSSSQPAAAAAQKAPASTASAATTTKPTATTTKLPAEPSEAAKAKLRAENTKKILEKMAALKKQQEKRPEAAEHSVATPTTNDTVVSTVAPTAPAATTPQPAVSSVAAEPSSVAISAAGGTSVAPSPQPNAKPRAIKRPVAADFDGYPSNSNILKRTRTQETLIIDVSDDEDVEMDLGSPTEPTASATQNSGITRQNSLASYPPLTNSRSWRGTGSGAATPGTGAPSVRGHKLDFLTQKIEEAKRQIAEAEAKKAAKKTNGASTPVAQSPVPPSGPMESARLPKPSEVSRSANNSERRDRIASYHLPVVEAVLRDKQEKLHRLQSEAAQLELEVQATLAERQKLTVEMATLDISTESESDKLNGLSEPTDSDTTTPLEVQPFTIEADTIGAHRDVVESFSAPEPALTAQKDASLSGDNDSVMDIDSDSSSEAGDSGDIITSAANVATNDGTQSNAANGPSEAQPMPLLPVVPNGIDEGQVYDSDNDKLSERTTAPLTAETVDQPSADADVPMQISDAEDEDDGYEPMPAQISGADKIQIAEGEGGEVPDEEPYEPSPARGSSTAAETVSEAKIDEAESRKSLTEKDLLCYQSPLRYFRAYRFHPKYLDDVSGGLKSMTYSSRVDISRPICPFLLDGGQCPNGSSCEFQHFDNMVLSDTAIIAELGSTDMYEGEQKGRFIDGLKKVLQDLKANKVKDFDSITKAIIAYRADFLGDKSKVLSLNNVTV